MTAPTHDVAAEEAVVRPAACIPTAAEVEGIPAELRATPHWVCWRWEHRGGKWTKPPYQPNGRLAESTGPETWSTFEAVYSAARQGGYAGIGYVLDGTGDLVGIDLDHCVTDVPFNPEIEDWALAIVHEFESYTEISPSGTGLRIFAHGKLPDGGRKRGNIEMYESGRYLTVTGRRLPASPSSIEWRQEQIAALHGRTFPAAPAPRAATTALSRSDGDIVAMARGARNGAKFAALYAGDTTGYPSQSEADAALVRMLVFWTQDAGQVDRIFRSSGLMREKWDVKHGDGTYGELTVRHALALGGETYRGPASRASSVRLAVVPAHMATPAVDRTVPTDTAFMCSVRACGREAVAYGPDGDEMPYCGRCVPEIVGSSVWFVRE